MKRKTVLLIDDGVAGHKYAFNKLFAKYLLKLNYQVVLVLPERSEEILKELKTELEPKLIDHLIVINHLDKQYSLSIFPKTVATVGKVLLKWWEAKKVVDLVEHQIGERIDTIFFSWLDSYLARYLPYQVVELVFKKRWTGLYFHPWYLYSTNDNRVSISSIDNIFRSKYSLGCAIHDEFVLQRLSARIKKNVVLFPEIADSSPPDLNSKLVREIKEKAQGRLIVSLIGIKKRKGFLDFLDLTLKSNKGRFFFFFSGPLGDTGYSPQEETEIEEFVNHLPENCLYYPHYLEEGAMINGIICASDILFLVYKNFRSSSNFSTKAALFQKPVLATDRFWIGETTKKYSMGVTVEEGDMVKGALLLENLSDQMKSGTFKAKWGLYLKEHGQERLKISFESLLSR